MFLAEWLHQMWYEVLISTVQIVMSINRVTNTDWNSTETPARRLSLNSKMEGY
jgi:hypothetical protein